MQLFTTPFDNSWTIKKGAGLEKPAPRETAVTGGANLTLRNGLELDAAIFGSALPGFV